MHSIEIGKLLGRVPYAKVGTDQNPILVINGGQGFMMKPSEARMAKDAQRLKCVLPDGRSFILVGYDPEATTVTVEELAGDVARIIDQYLGGQADVVGISYGGVVASRLALRSPESIGRLVMMASAPWFSAEGERRIRRQIDLIHLGELNALLREFTSMFRSPWLNFLVGLRVRLGRRRLVQRLGKPEVIIRYLKAMLERELPGGVAISLVTPTIIVGGSRDQFFAEAMVEAGASAPNLKTAIFENETHMVPIERARAVKQVVSDFFSSS